MLMKYNIIYSFKIKLFIIQFHSIIKKNLINYYLILKKNSYFFLFCCNSFINIADIFLELLIILP